MQKILLIGAGGGMGTACAHMFLENGAAVIGLDRPGAQMPKGITPVFADVSSEQSVQETFECVCRETDTLDAIVYMAGIYEADSLVEITEDRLKRIFEINTFGAYRIVRAFLPLLKTGARVVFVTSELADLDPLPFTGLYCITKATLDRYAFSLAMELQLLDIHVSVIRPGAVETPLLDGSVRSIKTFTDKTVHYPKIAQKFLRVTTAVEAKAIPPERLAQKIWKILHVKHPRFRYAINRNPLLRLYGVLPKQLKLFAIRTFLNSK